MQAKLLAKLGPEIYREKTGEYRLAVSRQFARYGCPRVAADNVIALLDAPLSIDPHVRSLVKCAALDVAIEMRNSLVTNTPLLNNFTEQ